MAQVKTNPATSMEAAISSLVSAIQNAQMDPQTVRWYSDRDAKPQILSAMLADLLAYQAVIVAAGNKAGI
jgi:hypothetical protein